MCFDIVEIFFLQLNSDDGHKVKKIHSRTAKTDIVKCNCVHYFIKYILNYWTILSQKTTLINSV